MMSATGSDDRPFLVVRVGERLLAVPLDDVVETMRALPLEAIAGVPPWLAGVAIIRGVPVPVVAMGVMLTIPAAVHRRFITLKVGARSVAIAVDAVLGVRNITALPLHAAAPLLQGVGCAAIDALATLDAELVLVLRTCRVLSEAVLQQPSVPG
jgi:purine-binding chemotaxis protein CheW